MTEGGKRRANKSLKQWVAFVKKVAKEEGLEYKDAMQRAKVRSDKGEKWQKGGNGDTPAAQTPAATAQTPETPAAETPAATASSTEQTTGGEGEQMNKTESAGGQRQRQQRSAKQRRSARQQRKGGQRNRQQSRRNRRQSRRDRR